MNFEIFSGFSTFRFGTESAGYVGRESKKEREERERSTKSSFAGL